MPAPPHVSTPLVVVSPHRDDAAFSASRLLVEAANAQLPATILNLFTRSVYAPFHPRPLSIDEVTALRLAEDHCVITRLGPLTHLVDLELADAPLRLTIADPAVLGNPLSAAALQSEISSLAALLPPLPETTLLVLPLGLGNHIDHRIARDAALSRPGRIPLAFYQDLPYACRSSSAELAAETASLLAATNLPLQPFLLRSTAAAEDKRRLAACYPSQVSRETVEEMAAWTGHQAGEFLFLSPSSAAALKTLLPSSDLVPLPEFAH